MYGITFNKEKNKMLAQNWIKVCGMTATCAMLYSSVVFMGQISPGGNFSITAGKPADVELGRGLPREQRSGLTKE